MWRYNESPLVDGDKVVCTPGGQDAMLVALDKLTGKTIWKSKMPSSTPPAPLTLLEHPAAPAVVPALRAIPAALLAVRAVPTAVRVRRSPEPKIRACSWASIGG
jgi:hypothetical protein